MDQNHSDGLALAPTTVNGRRLSAAERKEAGQIFRQHQESGRYGWFLPKRPNNALPVGTEGVDQAAKAAL